jgi:amino acid permease
MVNSTADRLKRTVQLIEIAEKVSKYLPVIVFSYAGLTLVFAVIYLLEHNVVAATILWILTGFGIYLAIRISLVRVRWKRNWQSNQSAQSI